MRVQLLLSPTGMSSDSIGGQGVWLGAFQGEGAMFLLGLCSSLVMHEGDKCLPIVVHLDAA